MREKLCVIKKEFPGICYAHVSPNDSGDLMFISGEGDVGLVRRAYDFMSWLATREEEDIAVVCHSKFLFALMSGVMDVSEGERGELRGWFGTGEVRTVNVNVFKL